AFDVCAAISTLLLVPTSIHAFTYDYIVMVVPCWYIYKWVKAEKGVLPVLLKSLIIAAPIISWITLLFLSSPDIPPPKVMLFWSLIVAILSIVHLRNTLRSSSTVIVQQAPYKLAA